MAYDPNKSCMEARPEILDFALKNNQNVMIVGGAGCGKTTMIRDCFNRFGLIENQNWKYYSTPTLDPWINFVGVPKEKSNGVLTYLDFIRPLEIASGEMEAFFFDEYNRAASEVKQAVMELIQFKSINGLKFPKLKVVWAAINPYSETDDTYDTTVLDKAQKDRFVFWLRSVCKIDIPYFTSKFGERVAKIVAEWWTKLPEDVKDQVTPRRMEYACEIAEINPQMLAGVLIPESNPAELIKLLSGVPFIDKMRNLFRKDDKKAMSELVAQSGSFASIRNAVANPKEFQEMLTGILNCTELALEKEKKYDKEQLLTCVLESLQNEDMLAIYSASDDWVRKQITSIPNLGSEVIRNRFKVFTEKHNIQDAELMRVLSGETGATLADKMREVLVSASVDVSQEMSGVLSLVAQNVSTKFLNEKFKNSCVNAWRTHYLQGRSLVNIPNSYKSNIIEMCVNNIVADSDFDLTSQHEKNHFDFLMTHDLSTLKVMHDVVISEKTDVNKVKINTALKTMLATMFKNWLIQVVIVDKQNERAEPSKQITEGNAVERFCNFLCNSIASTQFRSVLLAGTEGNETAKRVVSRDAWFDLYHLINYVK